MLTSVGRLALLISVLAASPRASAMAQGNTGKVVSPDAAIAPRRFWRDSLAQRIQLHGGTLDVLAERSRTNPNVTTGKYVVRWNGRQIAVGDHESLMGGAPVVAAVFPGDPMVVALSTYTGGQGIPGYYVKLIVLEPSRQLGSVAFRAFSLGATEEVSDDEFFMAEGPEDGEFVLEGADFTLTYAGGALRIGPPEDVAAPVSDAERSYVAAMRSDLRNLVTAQEAFFADSVKYASRPQLLAFRLSPGNRWVSLRLTTDGWTAVIGNANARTVCAIFVGSTAIPPATGEGEPACR